ncbi:hypothetical protein TrLO_g1960 [Triparma laevis f. longispina]|uniref:Uncharacterized protein n=1 Tax=Triparma laevis f. longispina TaxID=1714387 RepID=A0A9W7A837_9STRA|nr:hypothetical protein TrLO_g1960 [Triparma laevis f. longispina]
MNKIVQHYSHAEDAMISSAQGLIDGLNFKGATPFRDFRTTFSAHRYLKGFFNSREGDISAKSRFVVRGNHAHVAARLGNYYYQARNPAFGKSSSVKKVLGIIEER